MNTHNIMTEKEEESSLQHAIYFVEYSRVVQEI